MQQFKFSQKAFIVNDGKLLLVKKSGNDPYHPNEWEVPGGRMKFGEKPEEHIKREVKEEVGLDIEIGSPFAIWSWILEKEDMDADNTLTQIVAVGSYCRPLNLHITPNGRVTGDYLSDIKWVPVDKVLTYNLIPDIIPAMKTFVAYFKNSQWETFSSHSMPDITF